MNPNPITTLTCALAVSAGAAFSQNLAPDAAPEPAHRIATSARCEGFPGVPATPEALLELRLARHGDAASLELRGGAPATRALIVVATASGAPVAGQGEFDPDGRFALPFDAARFAAGQLVCQGYAATLASGRRLGLLASNGLRVEIEAAPPAAPPAAGGPSTTDADVSLLRIELDEPRAGLVKRQVLARDLVGALDTALNSHGDTLQAKLGGKVMVLVPGTPVQVGGSVAFAAKIARDGDEYLVAIGEEVAVLCGVKATKGIGIEGGVTLGADQIYRFASPGEVARGLIGIALQQALPGVLEVARSENLAKLRELRQNITRLVAALDHLRSEQLVRIPAVEHALDGLLRAIVVLHAKMRLVGDVLDRAATWLVTESQLVRDHTDGAEVRFGLSGEVSLKIGDKKLGDRIGAELGGKINGGVQATVRMFQRYREEAQRVEVLIALVGGASLAAGVKLGGLAEGNERAFGRGFEASYKVTRGLRTVLERRGDGLAVSGTAVVIKHELGVLGFSRETTVEIDAALLRAAGEDTISALLAGEPARALGALAGVTAHVTVQDKLTLALRPELGVENTGLTAKVAAEASWCDCGPLRQIDVSLTDVLERLLDAERTAGDAERLVQQVLELPQLR